jgi:phage terminase large subunit-like protein
LRFLLVSENTSKLKGRRFQDVTEIQEQSLTVLHAIPKSQFQRCFQQWQKRWTRCINSEGEYLEGDKNGQQVSEYFVINSVQKRLDTPS